MTKFMSDEINQLGLALSKAQAWIKNATKDKQGFNYKYADLAACLDAIREPFASQALSISQIVSIEDGQQVLITLLMHESGQWLKSTFILKSEGGKGTNDMQAFGSGMTYARRYSLAAMCGLSQEDDDGAKATKSPLSKNEPQIYEKTVSKTIDPNTMLIKTITKLCLDHEIDLAEFAKFHNIESKNPESVKNAVANFDTLKDLFKSKH
jgi:hypothetical protein